MADRAAPPRILPPILPWALAGTLAALGLAIAFYPMSNADMMEAVLPWMDALARHGGWQALALGVSNYTPAYEYLMLLMLQFDGILPRLLLVKLVNLAFAVAGAALAAAIVAEILRALPPEEAARRRLAAYLAVLLLPTVVVNGSIWGQADSIHTAFLLATLLALLKHRPALAMAAFGAALSIKLLPVFLAPLLLGLLLRREIRPWHVLLVPAIWFATLVPAWIAGRPLLELLLIYPTQSATYARLSMNAATLYALIPLPYGTPAIAVGLVMGALCGIGLALAVRQLRRPDATALLLLATLCMVLLPFLTPKMHERYFFGGEVLAVVLALVRPGLLPVALLLQASALMSYIEFLHGTDGRVHHRIVFTLAPVLNAIAIAALLHAFQRHLAAGEAPATASSPSPAPPSSAPPSAPAAGRDDTPDETRGKTSGDTLAARLRRLAPRR